ncbi:hypothetical protein AMECASPLE_039314 [Ameca splendens]|uniref:Uncharacterized protein n=1 Tax=Ameca splendens TaxID=208324 RepID=A0ABV0XXS8_9TELE
MEWKPRGRSTFYRRKPWNLSPVFTCVMFIRVWKLQPPCLSFEPPFCFQLQTQLLKSRHNLTSEDHKPACPPSSVISPTTVEFPGREETHFLSASSHQADMGKDLLLSPPGLTKNSTSRDPNFACCSSPGSSPTLKTVS